MDLGVALPQMGPQTTPDLIVRIAQEAEQLNYASLWVGERLLRPRHYVPFGYPPGPLPDYFQSCYDPLTALSFIAAKTERIKLGTSVIVPFFHVPVVLAKQLASLDQFSQGRVIACLGQGWLEDEFKAANISLLRRGYGLEDYIGALRAIWGADPVHYEGRFYQIVESDIGPKPYQSGGPPVLFGVGVPAALVRAARLADGLNPLAQSWRQLSWIMREFPEMVRQAGRDPQQMMIVVRSNQSISERALSEPRPPLSGSLEQIREDIQRMKEMGIRHIFFDLVSQPINNLLRLLEKLRGIGD